MAAKTIPPPSPLPPEIVRKQAFDILQEIEYNVELFNRLTHTCFKKCVDNSYREAELYIGENSCIDRCVSKYRQVTNLIGHILASGQHRK